MKFLIFGILASLLLACSAYAYEDYPAVTETFEVEIGDYNIIKADDSFDYLELDIPFEQYKYGFNTVVPAIIQMHSYPEGISITGVKLDSMEDPVTIKANLPDFNFREVVERACTNEQESFFEFEPTPNPEGGVFYTMLIVPVEVVDCENGIFRLYKKIKYHFEYIPLISVHLLAIEAPDEVPYGSGISLSLDVKKMVFGNTTAKFELKDESGDVISETKAEVSEQLSTLDLFFPVSLDAGLHELTLSYLDDHWPNPQEKIFWVEVVPFKMDFSIPERVRPNQPVTISVGIPGKSGQEYSYYIEILQGLMVYAKSSGNFTVGEYGETLYQKTTGLKEGDYNLVFVLSDGNSAVQKSLPFEIKTPESLGVQAGNGMGFASWMGIISALLLFVIIGVIVFKHFGRRGEY